MPSLCCSAVLFDLDGVLVDSSEPIRRSWAGWAAEHGIALEAAQAAAHGRRAVDAIRYLAPYLDAEAAAREMDEAQAFDTQGVVPVAGAGAVLASLHRDEWAVVTSGRRQLALARMHAAGLPLPGVLVSAEDVTVGKPSPEGYLRAARLIGAPPAECVVIEDAEPGVAAARNAGMQVIGLAPPGGEAQLGDADSVVSSCLDIVVTRNPRDLGKGKLTVCAGRHR